MYRSLDVVEEVSASKKSILTSETEDQQTDDTIQKCITVGDPEMQVDSTRVPVCEVGYSPVTGRSLLINAHEAGPSHGVGS